VKQATTTAATSQGKESENKDGKGGADIIKGKAKAMFSGFLNKISNQ